MGDRPLTEGERSVGYRRPDDWSRGRGDALAGRRRRWFQGPAYVRGFLHGRQERRYLPSGAFTESAWSGALAAVSADEARLDDELSRRDTPTSL